MVLNKLVKTNDLKYTEDEIKKTHSFILTHGLWRSLTSFGMTGEMLRNRERRCDLPGQITSSLPHFF